MAATFTLTAIPRLLTEGDHKGHLEYVTFVATDRGYSKKWTATNIGTFVEDFTRIVLARNAQDILRRLREGEIVMFPGLYELYDLLHKFGGSSDD